MSEEQNQAAAKPSELSALLGVPPPIYGIETLNDLLNVPPDKVGECLRGLEYAVRFYQLALGKGADDIGPIVLEWTDDGSNNCTLTNQKGDAMLTLEVTPNAQANRKTGHE